MKSYERIFMEERDILIALFISGKGRVKVLAAAVSLWPMSYITYMIWHFSGSPGTEVFDFLNHLVLFGLFVSMCRGISINHSHDSIVSYHGTQIASVVW